MFKYILSILIIILLLGCNSSPEVSPERLGREFFPIEVGMYRIYDMKDTTYFLSGPVISNYQLRETVIDSMVVNGDTVLVGDSTVIKGSDIIYTLERATRVNESDRWRVDSIWTTRVDPFRIVSTENNVPYIKLVFPIERRLTWNGNLLNVLPTENYRYDNSLNDTILFEKNYDQLWRVVQSEKEPDIIGKDLRSELYAKGVGLVLKNLSVWAFCQDTDSSQLKCNSTNPIVDGRGLVQTLIEHGKK